MDDKNWEEETYNRVFDDICDYVAKRRRNDKSFTIHELKQMIDEAYVRRGMDWIGKGNLQFIIESATIAALEQQFVEWDNEQKKTRF